MVSPIAGKVPAILVYITALAVQKIILSTYTATGSMVY